MVRTGVEIALYCKSKEPRADGNQSSGDPGREGDNSYRSFWESLSPPHEHEVAGLSERADLSDERTKGSLSLFLRTRQPLASVCGPPTPGTNGSWKSYIFSLLC